jgi:hypothetical protein
VSSFFHAITLRARKLDPKVRSLLEVKILELLVNAENIDNQPFPYTPLPLPQPPMAPMHYMSQPSLSLQWLQCTTCRIPPRAALAPATWESSTATIINRLPPFLPV